MDLKLADDDLDITDGSLSFVTGIEAKRQHIAMRLRTWLGETPYDRAAGVPYLQAIFARGTTITAIEFILTQIVADTPGVVEVLELNAALNTTTRELAIAGRARVAEGEVDFAALTELG